MRGLKELEDAIGRSVVELGDAELSTLIQVLSAHLRLRIRDHEASFESMAHESWRGVKRRPKNALLVLRPKPSAKAGRKKTVDISDADLVKAVHIFKTHGLGDGETDVSVLREVLLWKTEKGKRTTGRDFEQALKRLQSRLSEVRRVLKSKAPDES